MNRDEPTHSHPAIGNLLLAVIVLLILALAAATPAQAHEVSRADCATYQRMHLLVTGSHSAATRMGRRCRIAATAHNLTHPLPDAEIPFPMRMVRACESGKRTKSGRGIDGTFNYTAQNRRSTASGAYQYLDTTWGGHMGYAKARLAPPRIQDRRAIRDYRNGGLTPWAASRGCWG